MAQSLEQFAKSLLASGLPFAAEFESWLRGVPKERRPADGEQCARVLVKEKKLTAYQAQEIYAGRGKKLVLGNYVIQDKLGQGGMGMVLKAEHKRMGRMVALKVMSAAGMANPDAVKRFQREVQAAAKLSHANIVAAHDADEAAGQHFLVMEYVEGSDLSQLVKKNGPMSVEKALHCILQAAKGLEFAHSKGIVHRDIKPANLLLDGEGTVKILDMGLARLEHSPEQGELTGTGQIMGTVDYMAPEQAMSTKTADARADIYSLGITLWYLLTARVAYEGDTLMAKLMAHSTAPIPYLASVNMQVSPSLERVFQKMVAKTPAERFQSMTEVIAALEAARTGREISPTVQLPKSEDSKLSEFLKGMGSIAAGPPGRSGIGAGPVAAVAAPPAAGSTNAAFEQTIDTGHPQADTDPNSEANLIVPLVGVPPSGGIAAAAASPKPTAAKPWHSDWRVWAFGSAGVGGVLLIALVLMLMSGREEKPPTTAGKGNGVPSTKPVPGAFAADGDGALVFSEAADHVDLPPLPLKFEEPFVIEAWTQRDRGYGDDYWRLIDFQSRLELRDDRGVWDLRSGDYGSNIAAGSRSNPRPKEQSREKNHVAAQWTGREMQLFVNGVQDTNAPASNMNGRFPDANSFLQEHWKELATIPGQVGGRPPGNAPGKIFSLRVSRGVRYSKTFIPGPLAPDENTIAAYSFDEGSGDILKDSSGHNHHGKIVGAKWVRGGPPSSGGVDSAPTAPARSGLTFAASEDRVTASLAPAKAERPLTVEAWLTLHRLDGHRAIAHLGSGDDVVRLWFANREFSFGYQTPTKSGWAGANHPQKANQTYHVAGTWDADSFRVYIDGRLTGTVPCDQPPTFAPDSSFTLGSFPIFGQDASPGKPVLTIHSVRISKSRYTGGAETPFTPPARFTADSDTLALYEFNEGSGDELKDFSGHNHHGKIVGAKWVRAGAAGRPAPASGAFALEFDGKASYVQLQGLRVPDAPFTVEAVVTPRTAEGGQVLVHSKDHAAGALLKTDGHWSGRRNGHECHESPGTVAAGKRVHLAGVWNGEKFVLYVDGVPHSDFRESARDTNQLDDIILGAYVGAPGVGPPGYFFDGQFHQLRYTSGERYRAAFTPPARMASDASTLAFYNFDEGTGDVLKDSSGNDHHGKIFGAKWVRADGPPNAAPPLPAPTGKAFGLQFDGDDEVRFATRPPYDPASCTIEAYVRIDAFAPRGVIYSPAGQNGLGFDFAEGGDWRMGMTFAGGGHHATQPGKSRSELGRRYHVAGVSDAEGTRVYVDGKFVAKSPPLRGRALEIPKGPSQAGSRFQGVIEGIKFSKTPRYTSDFSPPARLDPDADTIALYRFDEGTGDVLRDSSGHNHHGQIVGAKWVNVAAGPRVGITTSAEQDAYAARSGLPVKLNNTLGMKFRLIPPGEFVMGSAEQNPTLPADDRTPHKVGITAPFYLGTYEVSQEEYQAVSGANPSAFRQEAGLPVEMVSWLDAVAYCNALSTKEGLPPVYDAQGNQKPGATGYRLPTEAEWEYAARAGTTGTYYFNDPAQLERHAWIDTNSGDKTVPGRTHRVGGKTANPWGLCDMYGNVWEWCHDWYAIDYYRQAPPADPAGPATGAHRLFRGGAWDNTARDMNNSYARPFSNASYLGPPTRRDNRIGFRVVLGVEGAKDLARRTGPKNLPGGPPF